MRLLFLVLLISCGKTEKETITSNDDIIRTLENIQMDIDNAQGDVYNVQLDLNIVYNNEINNIRYFKDKSCVIYLKNKDKYHFKHCK